MTLHEARIAEIETELAAATENLQAQIQMNIGTRSELQSQIQQLIEQEAQMRQELVEVQQRSAGAIAELTRLESLAAPEEPAPEEPPVTP